MLGYLDHRISKSGTEWGVHLLMIRVMLHFACIHKRLGLFHCYCLSAICSKINSTEACTVPPDSAAD